MKKTAKTTKDTKQEVQDEVQDEVVEIKMEASKDLRECTCGNFVQLPNAGEDFTLCECGIKHIR